MAKTQGHGNPKWSREETILALELYHSCEGSFPADKKKVEALSSLLRSLPYHASAARNDSFRNFDSVSFKLLNLRSVATGLGLSNVSEMDRLIWAELGQDEKKVLRLAESIREGAQTLEGIQEEIDDDLEFAEGKAVTRLHNIRERNPRLRKKLLAYRKQKDTMYCDICSTSYVSSNESIQDAMFEAHHVAPLATRESKITKLSDMALLCANCHRLLHRAISVEKRWFSLKEAKELIYPL